MGSIEVFKKLIQNIRYRFLFFFDNSLKNGLKLSKYSKNSLSKKIKFKFLEREFIAPLGTQTLIAIDNIASKKKQVFDLYNNLDKPPEIFDIGANIGYWSFSFLHINKNNINKIYCFEPHKLSFDLLTQNFKDEKTVKLFNYGLSNIDEVAQLSLPEWEQKRPHNLGLYSVVSNSDKFSQTIKLKKFDDHFVAKKNINYLFKIDVEGMEFKVLEGAKNFLSCKNNISIMIELNSKIDGFTKIRNVDKSIKFLKNLNFKPFLYSNTTLSEISYEELSNQIN